MVLRAAVAALVVIFLLASSALCAEREVWAKLKENTPITTAYGYELGQGTKGDTFVVQEARGDLMFGFYPMATGGIRGYVPLASLDATDDLNEFVEAEESRREKLKVAIEKKTELNKLPQPPGRTFTEYVEEKGKDFTAVSGVMLESVTWSGDKSPYLIIGPVYIPSGVILFVDPGVEVYSEKSETPGAGVSSGQVNGIIVAGNVLAIGRPDKIISFRGLGSKPNDRNTWGGIHILDTADPGSMFRWASFENAATGISCGRGPVISNCIFRYNYSGVLLNRRADASRIFNNVFISNTTGLEARSAPLTAVVYNNIFAYNQPNGGIRAWENARALITYNDMYKNTRDYIGWSPYSSDLSVNPMFVDMENGDYHLRSNSRLIGKGRGGSNIGLYGGRDAIYVPPEKAPEDEGKKEEKGEKKPKEKGPDKS